MEIVRTVFEFIPFVFMLINLIGAWRAKTELTEIKYIVYTILWIVIYLGDKVAS